MAGTSPATLGIKFAVTTILKALGAVLIIAGCN
jgi:hypothetical protein